MVHTANRGDAARLLERGFEVLFTLGRHRDGARLVELSRECALSKATTLRILRTLARLEMVTADEVTHLYRLGPAVGRLSAAALGQRDFLKFAAPVLERLRDETGETACLFRRQGRERVCMAVAESHQDLRFAIEAGQRRPLGRGAPGRILLAALPPAERETLLRGTGAEARRRLLDECAGARAAGFAVSRGEVVVGGTAAAAPVTGFDDGVLALAVFGPSVRLQGTALDRVIPPLRRAARQLAAWAAGPRPGKESDR